MKKVLALALAVTMLASMSVSAMAAEDPVSGGTIEFTLDEAFPTTGIHDPGSVGELGSPENEEWPEFIEGLHSWEIDFGERTLPAATGAVTFTTDGTQNDVNDNPVSDRLGLAIQLAVNTDASPWSPVTGTHTISVSMTAFSDATGRTLQGFTLALNQVTGSRSSWPSGLTGTTPDIAITPYSATASNTNFGATVNAATLLQSGVWGWEYTGVLAGTFDGDNIRVGVAQADILWTTAPTVV